MTTTLYASWNAAGRCIGVGIDPTQYDRALSDEEADRYVKQGAAALDGQPGDRYCVELVGPLAPRLLVTGELSDNGMECAEADANDNGLAVDWSSGVQIRGGDYPAYAYPLVAA